MLRHRRDRGGEFWISALPFFTSTVLIPALADFKRRNPELMLRIEATHQYADFNSSPVDVAIRYGREHSTGLKFEPLDRGQGLAGLRACADQRRPAQARRFVPPGSDPPDVTAARLATVAQAGRVVEMTPRGQLWLDSVPAMLEAAEQGLGVTSD